MSVANNKFIGSVIDALNLSPELVGLPIVDQLLNDVAVTSFGVVEVTDKGKAIAMVGVEGAFRPVADSNGNVRLFGSSDAAILVAKKSNLPAGVAMSYIKAARINNIGDPIAGLKSAHKAVKIENANAQAAFTKLQQRKSAAVSLSWDTAPAGSAEKIEYDDIVLREGTLNEWRLAANNRLTSLTSALQNAGIDPTTYLPLANGGGGGGT